MGMGRGGYRIPEYKPFFTESMEGISRAIMGKHDRERKEAREAREGELTRNAWMGDDAAMQDLAAENPELAMKVEEHTRARKEATAQTEKARTTAFQEDMETTIAQVAAFDDFEAAQGYGQRMVDMMREKYPERWEQYGAPEVFDEEAFNEMKTVGGKVTGKPIGVGFRGIDPVTNEPVMYQQHLLDNGRTVTRVQTDPQGRKITPAEWDAETALKLAEAKKTGTMQAEIALADDKLLAEMSAQARADIMPARRKTLSTIATISTIRNHPGLKNVVGVGWLNPFKFAPGTEARNFMVLAEQAQGKVFAEAYETLKGGGPITEFESAQAGRAIARMDMSQSVPEYLAALAEFEKATRDGYNLLLKKAKGEWEMEELPPAISDRPEGGYTQEKPATGLGGGALDRAAFDALKSGDWYLAPDNQNRQKP